MPWWFSLVEFVTRTLNAWGQAVTLHPGVAATLDDPGTWATGIAVAAVAGVSLMVGRSVVLAINRVRGPGLVYALVFSMLTSALYFVAQGLIVWGLGQILLDTDVPATAMARVVLLSSAPLWFGFLTAVPLLGSVFDKALSLWSLLALWRITSDAYATSGWLSGGIALAAFGLTALLSSLLRPLVARARDTFWRRSTGRSLHASAAFLLAAADIDGSEADINGPDALIDPVAPAQPPIPTPATTADPVAPPHPRPAPAVDPGPQS